MNLREDDYKIGSLCQACTSFPALQEGALAAISLVLPLLAEQHRTVAEVEALMALLDRLEASLAAAHTTRLHLLEALLHAALAPSDAVLVAA